MVCLCSRDKASQSRFDHFHGQRWIALDVAMWRMILPYFASLLDTRVERTLLNMNASETSTDFQILRVQFLIDNRDSRHCCPDLHPGESSWSWTRCPLPRLGYGAQMEPSWLTWHGIWSQTQIFFWHSLKHLKQFQNVSENWNVDNVDVHSRSLSSSCARLCWSRHGNQDLDSAGWLEVGGREQSVLPFFFTFSSASLCCSRLWQALAEARVVICCDWFQNLRLQACAAGFGLPYPHTQNRREARFTCPLKLSLRDWLKGSILPSHCDFMFRSTYLYTVYIYIYYFIFDQRRGKQDNFSILRSAISEWRQDGPCLAKKNLRKRWRRRF